MERSVSMADLKQSESHITQSLESIIALLQRIQRQQVKLGENTTSTIVKALETKITSVLSNGSEAGVRPGGESPAHASPSFNANARRISFQSVGSRTLYEATFVTIVLDCIRVVRPSSKDPLVKSYRTENEWQISVLPTGLLGRLLSYGATMSAAFSTVGTQAKLYRLNPSLRFFPVVPEDSPVFAACEEGDRQKLVSLFNESQASPFDTDPKGFTPLHVSRNPIVLNFEGVRLSQNLLRQQCTAEDLISASSSSAGAPKLVQYLYGECKSTILSFCGKPMILNESGPRNPTKDELVVYQLSRLSTQMRGCTTLCAS